MNRGKPALEACLAGRGDRRGHKGALLLKRYLCGALMMGGYKRVQKGTLFGGKAPRDAKPPGSSCSFCAM